VKNPGQGLEHLAGAFVLNSYRRKKDVTHINHRRSKRYKIPRALQGYSPSLSEWADRHPPALTAGGFYLHRHKHIRPAIADVLAELIGIDPERSR
jgi:hypothetical protein